MLAMSPLFPTLGWEYPNMEIGTQQSIHLDDWNLDSLLLPNYTTSQVQDINNNNVQDNNQRVIMKRSESSPRSVSSRDNNHFCGNVLAKKLNHNASERDRRKKINYLYSTLRSMLPANDHTKKLSIPATVGRVLKYIPELQKEVDNLVLKKDELLSKFSLLQGASNEFIQEQKPKLKVKEASKKKQSCSISTSKLGDKEIMIQISSLDNLLLPELILKLETDGLQVLDVSSFRTFGGSTFYNIHLWNDGVNNVNCDKLNEELPSFIQKQNMNHIYH
ncbi:hypothetical protein KSS87_015769 [Heliosperma pusillum]|nr:hypothetical protein KSS87_015769 [Heliosperma pusillum]